MDRLLFWIVAGALVLYVAGGIAFGAYLRDVRGRDYFAPDERAFQAEGQNINRGWRLGDTHVPSISGAWPYVNAAVVHLWGVSLTPMRLLSALSGVIGIVAAFALARVQFDSLQTARLAAVFVLLSPSLFIWSLTNLKERTLSAAITVAVLCAVLLVRRWSIGRWVLLLTSLVVLGELRHYYAVIVGWLTLAAFVFLNNLAWRRRAGALVALLLSMGWVLQLVTGTFLGLSLDDETVVRYVIAEPAWPGARAQVPASAPASPATTYSAIGQTTGAAAPVSNDGRHLAASLLFVLFGRFEGRHGAGETLARVMWPEWLASFALAPLALLGLWRALRERHFEVLLPAAFIAIVVALLAWTHGDDWTTFRFRALYWPLYLVIAAHGVTAVAAYRRRAGRLAQEVVT
jgi:4-amino-4-deoxy-L-arabinose transferase-like glycosyltransferase